MVKKSKGLTGTIFQLIELLFSPMLKQSPIPPMWKKEGLIHSYLEKERSQVGPKKREKATRFRHFFSPAIHVM